MVYKDLSDSPPLACYASVIVNSLSDSEQEEVAEMLDGMSDNEYVTIGNPGICATSCWWRGFFCYGFEKSEILTALQEIEL
ncbi:hypothetical protein [Pantoea cypripedii]|uniref:Uncharacterized protein n=1 Tax=Pantoea cypripedii TaxID=55209 RepID=A0A6B9G4Y2_PANCY|nr:hypothetical protein [Pantoea cypripedii]QGY29367.1 hypothetical protein CUN67_10655 [Pantoea cypripedii]